MAKGGKKTKSAGAQGNGRRRALPALPDPLPALPAPEATGARATRESEGQRMLREQTESLAELAAKLGVNKTTIHRWRSGEKAPGPSARAKLQAVLRIPTHTWGLASGVPDVPSDPPAGPARAAAAIAKEAGRATTEEELDGLLKKIRAIATTGLLPTEIARIAETEAKVLAQRYRCEKERERAQEILEDRMCFESPGFRRVTAALVAALKPYPEAMRAAVSALEAVVAGGDRAA